MTTYIAYHGSRRAVRLVKFNGKRSFAGPHGGRMARNC